MANDRDVLLQLEATAAATRRWLATLRALTDEDLREPSVLPGWTRGHVVTHVCRNADALTNLLRWAATGKEAPMYSSQEARDAAIEAGAGRPVVEQVRDAEHSADRFLEAARQLPSDRWDAAVTRLPGGDPFPVRRVGAWRRTEVEVHHADLGTAYGAADWPPDFLQQLLDQRRRELATGGVALELELTDRREEAVTVPGGPRVSGSTADVVWWLLGRGSGERLACSAPRLPDLGKWV